MQPTEQINTLSTSTEAHGLEPNLQHFVLGAKDIDDYLEFDREVYFDSETPSNHNPPYFKPEEIRGAMEHGSIFGVLLDGDKWVATYWFAPDPDSDSLEIANLVVRKEYRDRGIGTGFLDYAEAVARQRGLAKCTLKVDPLNARGLSLYMRHGYKAVSYVLNEPNGLDHWLQMVKRLDGEWQLGELRKEVLTSDEAHLRELLSQGWIGQQIIPAQNGDPRFNQIVLVHQKA